LRCWWGTGKDRRKKPDGFYIGKKIRDMKPTQDKMVASVPMANFQMAHTNSVTPFSISMQHPNQQSQVPKEAAVVDSATQHLLEENNQLLNQIAANIETCKVCIYLGFSCLQPFLLSHRVHGAWKPSNLIMAVSNAAHTY